MTTDLIPQGLDTTIASDFCLIYDLLTKQGFTFSGYCPSVTDLQWILYRNETEITRSCAGRLLYKCGKWKTEAIAGRFDASCVFAEVMAALTTDKVKTLEGRKATLIIVNTMGIPVCRHITVQKAEIVPAKRLS